MLRTLVKLSANVLLISLLAVAMILTLVNLSVIERDTNFIISRSNLMLRTLVKLSVNERDTDFIISRSNLMLRTLVNLSARNALQFLQLQY